MGKRSDFARLEKDCYDTPLMAMKPLLQHLLGRPRVSPVSYYEPCAGASQLWFHLYASGFECKGRSDIAPRSGGVTQKDAFDLVDSDLKDADFIITNPPWSRPILHPMIEKFRLMRPTWLLFDADWMHTKQAAPHLKYCRRILSVGRVKWIPDSKHTGKDNAAWYLFQREKTDTNFVGA